MSHTEAAVRLADRCLPAGIVTHTHNPRISRHWDVYVLWSSENCPGKPTKLELVRPGLGMLGALWGCVA